jgi:hypothetical protein
MTPMRRATRTRTRLRPPVVVALLGAAAIALGACGGTAGGSQPVASVAVGQPGASVAPVVPVASTAPDPTPVPGGQSPALEPEPTRVPTTLTDWGEIVDDLPATFPMHPDAGVADVDDGPFSGTFGLPQDAASAADWYMTALATRGYGVERSSPLEDGSIVLDAQADLPECRIQMAFRPADGSTIITVLVASACANGTQG